MSPIIIFVTKTVPLSDELTQIMRVHKIKAKTPRVFIAEKEEKKINEDINFEKINLYNKWQKKK